MEKDVRTILSLRPSELSKAVLQLKGKPLDLEEYKPFEAVYDISPPYMTIIAGRQIGKSVSLGAAILSNSMIRSYFSTLFISPLAQQTSRFSTAYLDPFMGSPIVKKHFVDSSTRKNVLEKSLNNGSRVTLGYAATEADADRIRGVAADALYSDEIQDQELTAQEVLSETLSASEYGFRRFTGTAKGENNTLTTQWKRSNMMEWCTKCDHCGKWTIPIDFDTCLKILQNPDGPGCVYCGKVLNVKKGKWLAAKPAEKNHIGFHMPQLIIPARCKPKKWAELLTKAKHYPQVKLANEVFGTVSGSGGKPLGIREAMACCNPEKTQWDTGFPRDSRNIVCTVLGVDWSVTGGSASYTVISIIGYDYTGRAYLLYAQRLNGVDILDQVKRVQQLYTQFECSMIGSDRGVGVLQGQLLQQNLGADKVAMINYVAAKHALRWVSDAGYFAADRTMCIDTMILKAKLGRNKIETPCWDLTQEFWNDALALTEEETMSGRRVYRREEGIPDDWIHSMTFANIAYMIIRGDFAYVEKDAIIDDNSVFTF
ncbi:MAG TPA: phage terminase large subunit family protein [Methanosarcina sp.]|nr:phage terminase large subunit family protein [Methanosarcina sp.]